MNDESYGLRFDIYERVHLADELVGISQLEEVELTPHIQVIPAGEQVTVRGSLLLVGTYIGIEDKQRSQSLEHWIPVEITLPLNRVSRLDDISVEIEYFDVDLLSTRTLNITGILSLHGITMEKIEPPTWEPEQFTVVHEAKSKEEENDPPWLHDYDTHQLEFTAQAKEQMELTGYAKAGQEPGGNNVALDQQGQAPQPPLNQTCKKSEHIDAPLIKDPMPLKGDIESLKVEENTSDFDRAPLTWNNSYFNQLEVAQISNSAQQNADDSMGAQTSALDPFCNDSEVEQDMIVKQTSVQGEQLSDPGLEMKMAFNKLMTARQENLEQAGSSTLLQRKQDQQENQRQNEEETVQQQVASSETKTNDDVKWHSLFLRRLDNNQVFKKVRLCIVQRQETLDTIADRYCMNSREIALYNRLSEMDVTEGQILYIPTFS